MTPTTHDWKTRPTAATPPTANDMSRVAANAPAHARRRIRRAIMARGMAVATWKSVWKTGVAAEATPKVTASPDSAPQEATSTGARRVARAESVMPLVSQECPPERQPGAGQWQIVHIGRSAIGNVAKGIDWWGRKHKDDEVFP